MAAYYLALFLSFYPHMNYQTCIQLRRDSIVGDANNAATEYQIPVEVLLTVAFMESHFGCARGSGGNWGAPIDRLHRLIPGRAIQAARILSRSLEVCGSWEGALRRFRYGLCFARIDHTAYSPRAMGIINRLRNPNNPPCVDGICRER